MQSTISLYGPYLHPR